MRNLIEVDYVEKTKRFAVKAPFFLADVCRSFPSRRFDPKTKLWMVPLVRANLDHLKGLSPRYEVKMTAAANEAVMGAEYLMAKPIQVPFPSYDFSAARTKYLPMEHQVKMLDHSWSLKASAWFAKMGTGKTFATIHLASARWMTGQIDALVIICPSTLVTTWRKELEKFATVPYEFKRLETKANWLSEWYAAPRGNAMRVLAISVEGLGISEKMFDAACGFYAAGRRIFTVCDESSRIKNPKALRTERAIKLGEASAYSLILNGTPIALGIQDLWAQFQFLDPNIIGTGDYWAYRTKYLEYGGFEGKQIIGYKNVDELMELLRPYTIEVDKSVLNLPPKINKERYIEATPEQRALFKQIIKGEGSFAPIKVDNALEKVLRLRQVVGGFRPYSAIDQKTGLPITKLAALDKNPKMNDLIEFIEDNFHGSKFIIWTTFRHELLAITDALANKYGSDCVAVYYGDTDMEERSRIEDKYCNGESLKFLVANPASAGLGLTLVSKYDDVMYYYSGTSAFIDRAQSEDRSHRIGQKNTVTIVDAVMEKSVDEIILKATAAKMSIEQWILEQLRQGKKEVDLLEGAF